MALLCAVIGYLAVCISTCGTQAATFKFRRLLYSTSAVSWNTAHATCSRMSGHLIKVDNSVTINALKYIRAQPEAAAVSSNIWMGLYNAAPTSDVPVYVWDDCNHPNNTVWFPGEPNAVQTDRCIITSPEYEWKTRNCSEKHAFFCENVVNVDCTFERETGQKCEMGGVLLSEEMREDACATRCQEDMNGSDICWAYVYNTTFNQCNLLFGSDPYMCETLQGNGFFTTGRRRCFKFADITGSEVISPADSFPDCNVTQVTTLKETTADSQTTLSTTVEATIHTSTTTSTPPSTTVMIPTPETTTATTISTTSAVTTPTTPSTTAMISTLETTTATTTTPTKMSVVTTATTPSTTAMISTLETTTATTTTPTKTSVVTTLHPTSGPDTTADTTVAPINSETATTQAANAMTETTLETTSSESDSAVTFSVTATVTTTTVPSLEITTTTTRSRPITSTTSTTTFSSKVPGGTFSPALVTFLSRLEAALTSPRSAPTPKVTSIGRHVYEVCVVIRTFTVAERKKRTDDIVTDLTLDKKNLSSYRRKKSSAEDERPSAQGVGGGVAIILLVTAALIIILPDCTSILMHVVHVHKKKQLGPGEK